MRFFFDENLSPRIARALDNLSDFSVVHLFDKFDRGTTDPVWLTALGKEGDWTVVSGDGRILKNRVATRAWIDAGLTTFFLARGWVHIPLWDQAWKLVKSWRDIEHSSRRIQRGTAFRVPLTGKFEVIAPPSRI